MILLQRRILLSDSVNSKRKIWQKVKDIRAEYNLINDLSFNLCVVLQSLVMRWSHILE